MSVFKYQNYFAFNKLLSFLLATYYLVTLLYLTTVTYLAILIAANVQFLIDYNFESNKKRDISEPFYFSKLCHTYLNSK